RIMKTEQNDQALLGSSATLTAGAESARPRRNGKGRAETPSRRIRHLPGPRGGNIMQPLPNDIIGARLTLAKSASCLTIEISVESRADAPPNAPRPSPSTPY